MQRGVLLFLLTPAGCGLGIAGDSSGGGENLPTLGAGPYGRLVSDFNTPADEPFVIADRDVNYAGAACLHRPGGASGMRMWFGMLEDGDTEVGIAAAEVADVHQPPDVGPHMVLADGANPAVIEVDGAFVMFFERGGDIVRADSDDGESWDVGDVVLADASAPTAAFVDGAYVLYVTRAEPGIWRADSEDGQSFALADAPAIVARPGVQEAFDTRSVGDPFLLVQTSDAGRHHWGLWFTGTSEPPDAGPAPTAVGFAGSFDGQSWERFGGVDPMLVAPAGGPCVLLDGGTGLMLYQEEDRLHLGIAAAVHP